jgi:hypothetical protein
MNRAPHGVIDEWIRAEPCDMALAMHDHSNPCMRSTQRVRRLVFFNLKKSFS